MRSLLHSTANFEVKHSGFFNQMTERKSKKILYLVDTKKELHFIIKGEITIEKMVIRYRSFNFEFFFGCM